MQVRTAEPAFNHPDFRFPGDLNHALDKQTMEKPAYLVRVRVVVAREDEARNGRCFVDEVASAGSCKAAASCIVSIRSARKRPFTWLIE
jgi:hypothetical protein